jgi:hypothetical protein
MTNDTNKIFNVLFIFFLVNDYIIAKERGCLKSHIGENISFETASLDF